MTETMDKSNASVVGEKVVLTTGNEERENVKSVCVSETQKQISLTKNRCAEQHKTAQSSTSTSEKCDTRFLSDPGVSFISGSKSRTFIRHIIKLQKVNDIAKNNMYLVYYKRMQERYLPILLKLLREIKKRTPRAETRQRVTRTFKPLIHFLEGKDGIFVTPQRVYNARSTIAKIFCWYKSKSASSRKRKFRADQLEASCPPAAKRKIRMSDLIKPRALPKHCMDRTSETARLDTVKSGA